MRYLVLILLIKFVITKRINYSQFCFQSEKCQNCDEQVCTGEYPYTCDQGLCSQDKLKCQELKLWDFARRFAKNARGDLAFARFGVSIGKCPAWNSSYVCFNAGICKHIRKIPFAFRFSNPKIYIFKQSKCKCPSKYSYVCRKDYCAIDKAACKMLNISTVGIKTCDLK